MGDPTCYLKLPERVWHILEMFISPKGWHINKALATQGETRKFSRVGPLMPDNIGIALFAAWRGVSQI